MQVIPVLEKQKWYQEKEEKHQIAVDEELHVIVEDTHEPIVTPQEFKKVQDLLLKKRTQPPAIKHAKHTFSGLIRCANCGKAHTFETQQDKSKSWRISSCTTRNYTDDFTSYKMCGNRGCKLDMVEALFYNSIESLELQLEDYIEQIKNQEISNEDLKKVKESRKQTKIMQVDKMKKKRKKIRDLIEDDFYEDDEEMEKMQEMKDMHLQIRALEKEIEEMDKQEEESEAVQVEKILKNIKDFLQGKHIRMEKKEQNEILHKFIDKIEYRKKGKNAKVEIEIVLKEEVKEILDEMGNMKIEALTKKTNRNLITKH